MTAADKTSMGLRCVVAAIAAPIFLFGVAVGWAQFDGGPTKTPPSPPASSATGEKTHRGGSIALAGQNRYTGAAYILGSLDQSLNQAMDKNPGIISARTKVASAEAELRNVQFEVARQVVVCSNDCRFRDAAATVARITLKQCEEANSRVPGSVSKEQIDAAKKALIEAEAKLERAASEMRFLTGEAPASISNSIAPSRVPSDAPVSAPPKPPLQMPRGPIVENIKQALSSPTELDFVEQPVRNVTDYLKARYRIEIQIDDEAFDNDGVDVNKLTLTVNLRELPLGAALQAWDDKFQEMKLVVRDYGILVTTRKRAQEAGYMPVVEFARNFPYAEPADVKKPVEPKAAEKAPPKQPKNKK
jgi:hypothetical protein